MNNNRISFNCLIGTVMLVAVGVVLFFILLDITVLFSLIDPLLLNQKQQQKPVIILPPTAAAAALKTIVAPGPAAPHLDCIRGGKA
jgi:hypothetical protein